jgi:hypothetical protein
MSGTTRMTEIKAVVLVHGAFADDSCQGDPLLNRLSGEFDLSFGIK